MGFSIYDLFKEDNEVEDKSKTPINEADDDGDNKPSSDAGGDDDFSIDTSLDGPEDGNGGNDADGDGNDDFDLTGGTDDSSGSSTSTSSNATSDSGDGDGNEDAVDANTDVFYSLSAEDQEVKIKELKNLYCQLYNSCEDLIDRLNDIETDEANLSVISRASGSMYDLKKYLGDYIVTVFPNRSYIENDIQFNLFLDKINTLSAIMDKFATRQKENEQ